MSKTAISITQGQLQNLYLQRQSLNRLVLQIIAFQISQYNPKQIILRLSDQVSFIDCLLVGPYTISNACIVSTQYARTSQSFKPLDIIQVSDFFCKIDQQKICQLRIIIRKIQECSSNNKILGQPEQISQLMDSNKMGTRKPEIQKPSIHKGTEQTPIKIQQQDIQPIYSIVPNYQHKTPANYLQNNNKFRSSQSKQDETLTLNDIMNHKQGNFIGRLLRIKFGQKQTKDGQMSFLYLGFLDLNGDLVRINLAGRSALKQSRELKKHRCYLIKGLQLFQGDKIKIGLQIRLKQRQYKIIEIQNEVISSQFKDDFYRWQHQNQQIESQMVDVVGLVQQIQQKISYKNANTFQEQRDVVRLVVRNCFKTTKISFWADNIRILSDLDLQKNQAILLTDIKKKKSMFLDFIHESAIILLDQDPNLKDQLIQYLPPAQTLSEPTNIQELIEFYQSQPQCTKISNLKINMTNINQKWIIYKMCLQCKKKVQKILQICSQCQKNTFTFKYNCQIQISDSSGSLNCVAFDLVCQQIFNVSAIDFSKFIEHDIKEKCQNLHKFEYKASIQHKNNRYIIRSLQKIQNEQSNENIKNLNIDLNINKQFKIINIKQNNDQ